MPLPLIWRALTALFLIASSSAWAQAGGSSLQPVPALTRAVIDATGTLTSAETDALQAQLQALERTRGAQVVVLMVATTAPEDIAAYANRVANTWKIGRRAVGDGVLIVVAKNDRRMRIEVAKSLEGAIPDIAAARTIDGAMKPRFSQGDYAGGLHAAVTELAARIAQEALPPPDSGTPSGRRDVAQSPGRGGFDWTDLAIFLFFGVIVAGPVARSVFGGRLGGLLLGGGVGGIAFLITSSALLAGGAGLIALLYTWLFSGRSGPVLHGGPGGWSAGPGPWAGGAGGFGSRGGGFSAGGGGDFGGGGASGGW